LIPNDALDELRVQEILNVIEDWFGAMGPTFRLKGQELLDARKAFCDGASRKFIALLVKRLEQNQSNGPFFVGNSLTIADLKVFSPFEVCDGAVCSLIDNITTVTPYIDGCQWFLRWCA
jgi:glutathione S-transferase